MGGEDGFWIDVDFYYGYWKIFIYFFSMFMDLNDFVILFSIILDRKFKIYILNIFILVCFLVVLSFLIFLLLNDCGEKVFYFIIVLLLMFIFLIVVVSMFLINLDFILYFEIYIVVVLFVGVLIIVFLIVLLWFYYRIEKRKILDWI